MGVIFAGPGEAIYHNRHYHRPYRAIADEMVLSRVEGERDLAAGEALEPLTALLVPEQPHEKTPNAMLEILDAPPDSACLITNGYLAAANFAEHERRLTFEQKCTKKAVAYEGATSGRCRDHVRYTITLQGRSACLLWAEKPSDD